MKKFEVYSIHTFLYVFIGDTATGKSYFASRLTDYKIFEGETDYEKVLIQAETSPVIYITNCDKNLKGIVKAFNKRYPNKPFWFDKEGGKL